MSSLITDLLEFSKLSGETQSDCVPLQPLVAEICNDLEIQILEKGAVIENQAECSVLAIPGQMRQMFQNLLSNALKFSIAGKSPHVSVVTHSVAALSFEASLDADGEFCRIEVQDNGIGFDEQYLDKIFTIFQRLTTQAAYEGTGIGLAITKKIVSRHGGIITAESKIGEGSKFIIVLPQHPKEIL